MPGCAWLLSVADGGEHDGLHACAIAVLASSLSSDRHDARAHSALFWSWRDEEGTDGP